MKRNKRTQKQRLKERLEKKSSGVKRYIKKQQLLVESIISIQS
jgi:hypothetical protein